MIYLHVEIYKFTIQSSIGFMIGFLMCRKLDPGSVGLNGACAPYGLGTGNSDSSSGMYAFGRGSAVVVIPPGIVYNSISSSA